MVQSSVQIRSKKVNIAINDGDTQIGVISFNPDDTSIYSKFIAAMERLTSGGEQLKGIDMPESDPGKTLETVEDFEREAELMSKIKQAIGITQELWTDVCRELDGIFGDGVCQCFTQGDVDPELLEPLIDAVSPYFKKSRQDKVGKYKALQSDVME